MAENVEATGQAERCGKAGREFVEQPPNVSLQFVALAKVKELERRNKRVADFPYAQVNLVRRGVQPDRQQADALRRADQRYQNDCWRSQTAEQVGHFSGRIGYQERVAGIEGGGHQRRLLRLRKPRVGSERIEPVSRCCL